MLIVSGSLAHAQATETDTQPAAPDPSERAAAAFWQAVSLYDQGDFAGARERFEFAHELTQDPELLYDIAQSYRQELNCERAKQSFRQFLEQLPNSRHAPAARRQIASLEAQCPTTAATDGTTPSSDSGTAPSAPPQEGSNEPRAAANGAPPVQPSLQAKPKHSTPPQSFENASRRWLATGALVAGAAAGSAALVVGLWNVNRHSLWKEKDRELARGTAPGESDAAWAVRQGANDQLSNEIHRNGRVALYLGIGAGAALATSAVLWLTQPEATPREAGRHATRLVWSCPVNLEVRSFYCTLRSSF